MKLEISACKDCPFFTRTLMSIVATIGNPNAEHSGGCVAPKSDKLLKITLARMGHRAMPIDDNRTVPKLCPLRSDPIHVEYAGTN